MQGGLINHGAGENGVAIVCQRDGQAIKPVHPLLAQTAFEPDLVNPGCIWIGVESVFVGHHLIPVGGLSKWLGFFLLFAFCEMGNSPEENARTNTRKEKE
ncbi:MAG: hypothetical protein HC804_07990 [Anaerolineae bacterium]|nr:hypothetical protein [Anaerolineae bacterium]